MARVDASALAVVHTGTLFGQSYNEGIPLKPDLSNLKGDAIMDTKHPTAYYQ